MRRVAAVLSLALLLAAVPAHAQPSSSGDDLSFTQSTYVRAGWGDLPRTAAAEPAELWNVVEYRRVQHSSGTESSVRFRAEAGLAGFRVDCTCGNVTVDGGTAEGDGFRPSATPGTVTVGIPASAASGPVVVSFRHSHDLQDALGFSQWFETPADASISLYVRPDQAVASDREAAVAGLPSTDANPGLSIWRFDGTETAPFRGDAWFVVHPGTVTLVPAGTTGGGQTWNDDLVWLFLALGIVVGAVLWSILVRRGIVQAKSRRQVASAAAHVEAAETVPAPVLEGRKRALLAALKEIEVARMNNEMPADVYDAVKADLKKQAVTVMRALEATTAAGEARQPPA